MYVYLALQKLSFIFFQGHRLIDYHCIKQGGSILAQRKLNEFTANSFSEMFC